MKRLLARLFSRENLFALILCLIVVLLIVIVFIQKRPQGLFALKGRFVEN